MLLTVKNFRSHDSCTVEFTDGMNIITGINGSGKTSLIEAIYIALLGKSWRSNFDEITKKDGLGDWWRIDLNLNNDTRIVKYKKGSKEFIINDKIYRRFPTSQRLPVILFEPNDMQLLYGSPARRRDFFDRIIGIIYPDHQSNVNKFTRVLRQRNNLLKQEYYSLDELVVWNKQMVDLSRKISLQRKCLIEKINQTLQQEYEMIAKQEDSIKLRFVPGVPSGLDLDYALRQDPGNTHIGAQKDDIAFIFNGKFAKTAASRGENRTILFALLAVISKLVRSIYGYAVILLDDIDSELDEVHRQNLYATPVFQEHTIATTLAYSGDKCNIIKL